MKSFCNASIDIDTLKKLKLPPVRQLGFIVPSLKESAPYYGGLFNIRKWFKTKTTGFTYIFKGEPGDMNIDIAVAYSGRMQIELIEVAGNDNNIYYEYPGREGFGLHHIGIVVSSLKKYRERLMNTGIAPLQEGVLKFGGSGVTRFSYMDTMEQFGFILELIETKAFGISLGMPKWLVSIGRITGDTITL